MGCRGGLHDWPEAELLELHSERFGALLGPAALRRLARNARLREKRLAILRELEEVAAEKAEPSDLLSGWIPPVTAAALERAGLLTLADLQTKIAQGGRWWRSLPAFGPTKARRLADQLETLLGPPLTVAIATAAAGLSIKHLDGSERLNRVPIGLHDLPPPSRTSVMEAKSVNQENDGHEEEQVHG